LLSATQVEKMREKEEHNGFKSLKICYQSNCKVVLRSNQAEKRDHQGKKEMIKCDIKGSEKNCE